MNEAGGNRISNLNLNEAVLFETSPYRYEHMRLDPALPFRVSSEESCTVYGLEIQGSLGVYRGRDFIASLMAGEVLQAENVDLQIRGAGRILKSGIVGTVKAKGVQKISKEGIKSVTKHWGNELWLNGEHPGYAFKKIFLKAGTKTSLQYHIQKFETNVLFAGSAKLYFKKNTTQNDLVTAEDLGVVDFESGMSITVPPGTIHRIEAVTDLTLFETSTPHLDDVIRLADDLKRPSGRLSEEHRVAS